MKKILLIFSLVMLPIQVGAIPSWDNLSQPSSSVGPLRFKHVGQYLSQAGFGFGIASVLSCVCDKCGAGFSLGCLSLGSFLLSPLAEEVFNPDYKINLSNIYKFKKLLPCGLSGFVCIAIGLRAMNSL